MKGPLNPELNVGDRVVIYHMEGESGVPAGTFGSVTKIERDPFESESDKLVSVKWDNGSTLAIVTVTDSWKKVPTESIDEQTRSNEYNFYSKHPDVFDNFDWRWFREYLKKVRESGIVNMFAASPLLYSGKEQIDRYYGENQEDNESFQDVLEMSEESKHKLIQGVLKYMDANNKSIDDIDVVNRYARKFSEDLLGVYINFFI
jgi:hypothetical protein